MSVYVFKVLRLVKALVRDLGLGSGDSGNHVWLDLAVLVIWGGKLKLPSLLFLFFQLEKQILCFHNKCVLAKLLRVTHPVVTLQRATRHISISRSTICNQSGPNYSKVL